MNIEIVNRDALILFPKKPFIDWVNYVFSEDPVPYIEPLEHDMGMVYLLPEKDSTKETIDHLKRTFREIFENELWDWCTDENLWPKDLTWKLFTEWFHFSIQSMVVDTVSRPVEKEEW